MLRITHDLPGKQLSLENIDKPYASVKDRIGCFAVLLLILAVLGVIGYLFYDTHVEAVFAIAVMLGVLMLLFIRAIVFPQKEILTVYADDDERQLGIALGLPGYQPSRNQIVAFSEIEVVRCVVPHGMGRGLSQDIPFELWVHSSKRKLKEKIQISGINTDVELLDLLLRLANIIQLPYYRIVVNDPQNFEICSTRVAEKGSQPVPAILEAANYKKEIVAASVTPPPPQVAGGVEGEDALPPMLKTLVWRPGQRVEFVKRWRVFDSIVLSGSLLCIACVVIMWLRPNLINTLLPINQEYLLAMNRSLLFPVFCGGVALAGWVVSSMRYRCQFNFKTRQANVRLRGGWEQFKLAEVQEIVLVQERHGGSSSSNHRMDQKTTYKHRLEAKLHNGTSYRLMFDRRSFSLDQCQQHYNELWPFTAALARLLNVPTRYESLS